MRLWPIYPAWYLRALATACRLLGRKESAVEAFEAAIARNPDNLTVQVGLASSLGEMEEPKSGVAEIMRLNPDFSIKSFVGGLSYLDPADLARF